MTTCPDHHYRAWGYCPHCKDHLVNNEAKYSGHTAEEVVELMGMLAAQHDIHSAQERIAIARRGYALLKDQASKLDALTKENAALRERCDRLASVAYPPEKDWGQ